MVWAQLQAHGIGSPSWLEGRVITEDEFIRGLPVVYEGLDGKTYTASFCRSDGLSYVRVKNGDRVLSQPIMSEREARNFFMNLHVSL